MTEFRNIVVLCGGVGAARFLRGLIDVVPHSSVTAIVNVADDMKLHGLWVSPDIDTVIYTLADAIDPDRGWGLRDESWNAMDALGRYGDRNWFSLGDRDLGTHLQRTALLDEGANLTDVTADLCTAWDIGVRVLPVSNDPISTKITRADTGEEISFQEYFVGLQHDVPVAEIVFDGIENAQATSDVNQALTNADLILIAPSNPLVSIAPVLGVAGVTEALQASRVPRVAVSPIVGGKALKGPAANMLAELGHRVDAAGVASLWSPIIDLMMIDDQDRAIARDVAACGVVPYVADTVMADPKRRRAVARATLAAAQLFPSRGA